MLYRGKVESYLKQRFVVEAGGYTPTKWPLHTS
jgi:hypothetical protein